MGRQVCLIVTVLESAIENVHFEISHFPSLGSCCLYAKFFLSPLFSSLRCSSTFSNLMLFFSFIPGLLSWGSSHWEVCSGHHLHSDSVCHEPGCCCCFLMPPGKLWNALSLSKGLLGEGMVLFNAIRYCSMGTLEIMSCQQGEAVESGIGHWGSPLRWQR